nr:reverse transcriptase domain-containing protein [Tanacetum cinerariifolium]
MQSLKNESSSDDLKSDNIQGYVSAAAVNYNQGNFGYRPLSVANQIRSSSFAQPNVQNNQNQFSQPQGYNRANNFNQDTSYQALIQQNQVVSLSLPKLISTRMTLELANRAICTPAGIARDVFAPIGKFKFSADFVIVDYERDPRVPLILGRPFLRTARSLIDVHGEELILQSINMININNDSYKDYLEDLFATNHLSGNPTFSSYSDLSSQGVIKPLSGNTSSSSPDHLLEEFADELALITSPSGNDDLPFDIEFDLREIKYLLNHDPTQEMDSILEDSVDECNLAYPNNDLVDTIPEMFTDKHTLNYSSPPLYDDVNDDLVELESDNDDVYDDLFESKEDKINESKLLIDELDPPRSINFLPSLEYDSVLYKDFSDVDALPSTNNKDKVFNPGILIHENLFEVTIRVTPDKNVMKISISNASLIIEDFYPPLYELPFHKEVPGSETILSFSSKNEKKNSTPGFSLLKEFILLFSRNYLIGAL